jgi:glycosyltransferase involved in cell wall biosynthesis
MPHFMMPCGLYGAMLAIWHYSPFYQRKYPLHRGHARDYWSYVAWCATDGIRDYPLLGSIPEWNEDLAEPMELPALKGDLWSDGFSVKMFLYAVTRYGGTFEAILREKGARHRVARFYWRGGRHHLKAPPVAEWQIQWIKETFGSLGSFLDALRIAKKDQGMTPAEMVTAFGLEDVRDELLAPNSASHSSPRAVHLPDGLRRVEMRLPSLLKRYIGIAAPWFRKLPTEFQLAKVTRGIRQTRPRPSITHPFGVNLFGYARGELGIGEDVRLVATALKANDIPFCIVDIELGKHVSQEDRSAEQWISDQPLYGINLFCQTGIEMSRFVSKEGLDVFHGRHTIGLWPWELPEWPLSCHHSYACVDEIWGISSYTARAYHSFPGPVKTMTLPVTIDRISPEQRTDFGLPEKAYLYLFTFDLHSRTHRKNPFGLIKAFQKAFPEEGADEVGLVIKVNHPERFCLDWRKIRAIAKRDPRIHLIEQRRRHPEVLALKQACDCYVSLHRAEGFGRGIAEALLIGKQVITTGASGNMDFCEEPRVALVRSKARPMRSKEYFWSHGQQWAEPDLDHAAELMREIRVRPRDIEIAQPDLSPATVGVRYAARLREIHEKHCSPQTALPPTAHLLAAPSFLKS